MSIRQVGEPGFLTVFSCQAGRGARFSKCSLVRQVGEPDFLTVFSCQVHNRVWVPRRLTSWTPQWGAADAEIEVPSGENTELKRSTFKALSRSAYSHTCYAYCEGFLPRLFLPLRSIHQHFFQNLSRFFLCWLWLTSVPV